MKKILTNLTFWVLLAITAGILLGHLFPEIALQPLFKTPIKHRLFVL
jgi:aerobic C4-dicarboxylate transport protein